MCACCVQQTQVSTKLPAVTRAHPTKTVGPSQAMWDGVEVTWQAVFIGECHPAGYRAQDGWASGQRAVVSPVSATCLSVIVLSAPAWRLENRTQLPKVRLHWPAAVFPQCHLVSKVPSPSLRFAFRPWDLVFNQLSSVQSFLTLFLVSPYFNATLPEPGHPHHVSC